MSEAADIVGRHPSLKEARWMAWGMLILAVSNSLSGVDGNRPERYVAGAVFLVGYCIIRTLTGALAVRRVLTDGDGNAN
jgi:hypothetical protein